MGGSPAQNVGPIDTKRRVICPLHLTGYTWLSNTHIQNIYIRLNMSTLTLSNYVDWNAPICWLFSKGEEKVVSTPICQPQNEALPIMHYCIPIILVQMTTSKLSVNRPPLPSPPSPPHKWQIPSRVLIDPPSPPLPSLPTSQMTTSK